MIELETINKIQYKGFSIWIQSYLDDNKILFQAKIFASDGGSVTITRDFVTKNEPYELAKDYIDEFLIEN